MVYQLYTIVKVLAKHANSSTFGCTEHYLESQPQRRQESSGLIDLLYIAHDDTDLK